MNAYIILADFLFSQNKIEEAKKCIESSFSIKETKRALCYYSIIIRQFSHNNLESIEKSIEYAKKALSYDMRHEFDN